MALPTDLKLRAISPVSIGRQTRQYTPVSVLHRFSVETPQRPWARVLGPTSGSTIIASTPLLIEVAPSISASTIQVTAGFENVPSELVYDGSGFVANYASSTKTLTAAGTYIFVIQRVLGWPEGPSLTAYVTS
jgi:hypothetical protein